MGWKLNLKCPYKTKIAVESGMAKWFTYYTVGLLLTGWAQK